MFTAKSPSPPETVADDARPRSMPEKLLTATPVIMTVLATLLAGLSSSEMTQAQYHRSLAAQTQSKAGDQWAFFQAKRIRGTIVEHSALLAQTVPTRTTSAELNAASLRWRDAFAHGEQRAQELVSALGKGGPSLGPVKAAAAALLAAASTARQESARAHGVIVEQLSREPVQTALAFLGTDRVPQVVERPFKDPDVDRLLQAVRDQRSEDELVPLVRAVTEEQIAQAIGVSEANARAFEDAGKPADRVLREFAGLLRKQLVLAQSFHAATDRLREAVQDIPDEKEVATVQMALTRAERADKAIASRAHIAYEFGAAREDYTARRNGREARFNQAAAALYEIRVRKSGVTSERHRLRSKNFFYGMLVAQAGVTFSSLSLAIKKRNALLSLAGLTGLAAMLFSGYVYLYL